jgi:phosphate transport system substrate-binding protein
MCGVVRWMLAVALLATGCTGSGSGTSGTTIRIDGSSTVYPISAMMMEMFREGHSASRVVVGYSGTGGGMKKFIAGEIDICDASRKIKDSEVEACQDAGVEFIELEVAYDGLAIVVSKENSWCDCLTTDQLKKLWQPEDPAQNWSDLDSSWPTEKIVLYGPGVDSGTFDYFTEVIMGEAKRSRSDYSPSENDNVLVTGVSSNRFALGYFGFFYYEENKEKLKLLGVDSGNGCMQPTMETVSQNTYKPLSRPLYIYVRKSSLKDAAVAEFVSYYLENAAEAAGQVGYVPVKPEIHEANMQLLTEATR